MKRATVLLALALAAATATPAAADDASLRDAGRSRDPKFARLGELTRGEIDIVEGAVEAEQPSTEGGATYKRLILRSLVHFDATLRLDTRAVRAFMRGRQSVASRAWRRAARHLRRSARLERRAIRAIEA